MFFDKLLNQGQTHTSIVSTVKVEDGYVVNQFSWRRNGNGGLTNEDKSLVGIKVDDLPSGYIMRKEPKFYD